jgi:branched-chain amino acid transport system substrate-binding protein
MKGCSGLGKDEAMLKRMGCSIVTCCWMVLLSFPAFSAQPAKIAAIFSLSGIAAAHNEPLIPMIELAVDELNQQGGLLGHPVELTLLDNQSTPIGSKMAAEQAVRLGVIAVIGAHWSSHSLAMAPILQQAGIPMISPGSTNPQVTLVGDYIFRACFVDSFQGQAMANFAYQDLKARKAAVFRNVDETYSVMLADFFVKSFRGHGGDVVMDIAYRGKAVDFSDILSQVKKRPADVIYVPGYTRDSGLLIKQAVSMGISATFLGGDAWDEIWKYAGEALEGSYQTAPWHPDVPFERSIHLKTLFRQKYGHEIQNLSTPLAYDAVMLLADAVKRAGSLQCAKVRDALSKTVGFAGATGIISFNGHGDPSSKDVIILQWNHGQARYLKTVKP